MRYDLLPTANVKHRIHLTFIYSFNIYPCNYVTESKLVLLAAQQASKSRDKVLGQGIVTLFGKQAAWEDGGLMSQRTVLPELDIRLLLYKKGRGGGSCLLQTWWCWPDPRDNVIILCFCSCPHRSGHDVPINLQQDKCYFLFCNF